MSPFSIHPEHVAQALSTLSDAELRERLARSLVMLAQCTEVIGTMVGCECGAGLNAAILSMDTVDGFINECLQNTRNDVADPRQLSLVIVHGGGGLGSEHIERRPVHSGMRL